MYIYNARTDNEHYTQSFATPVSNLLCASGCFISSSKRGVTSTYVGSAMA